MGGVRQERQRALALWPQHPKIVRSEQAVTVSHCRREGKQRCEQHHFYPEIASNVGHSRISRRGTGPPPLHVRERRRY